MVQQLSRLGVAFNKAAKNTTWVFVSFLFVFLCACSGNSDHVPSETGISYDEMVSQSGLVCSVPERAEKVSYSVRQNDAGEDMAQVDCEIDGDVVRMIVAEDKDANATDTDISGMDTRWVTEQTCTIQRYDAVIQVNNDGEGYVAWKDDHDILYNICILENTSHQAQDNLAISLAGAEKLKGLAEEVIRG